MKKFLLAALAAYSLLMSSCDSGGYDLSSESLSDTTSVYGMEGKEVKLVKKAAVHSKVKNVESSAREISALAREAGGMIFNMQLDAVVENKKELKLSEDSLLVYSSISPRASIMARIPSENLEHFMYAAADMGYFTSHSSLNIDDKSLVFLENTLKQKNRIEVLNQPSPNVKPVNTVQKIDIKDEITNRNIQNRAIDADVKYSTIEIALYQDPYTKKEMVSNYSLADHDLTFIQKLGASLKNGWDLFQSVLLALANLWVIILLGLIVFFLYRYFQKPRSLA